MKGNDFDLDDPFASRQFRDNLIAELRSAVEEFGNDALAFLYRRPLMEGEMAPIVTRTYARELRHHWRTFCEECEALRGGLLKGLRLALKYRRARRTDEGRAVLEYARATHIQLIFEELETKYLSAIRTAGLFRQIDFDSSGYVILLRGFHFAHISELNVSDRDSSLEKKIRLELAEILAPVPLLWVANPSDSVAGHSEPDPSFRLAAALDWKDVVRTLIRRCSAIVVNATKDSEGLSDEMEIITEEERWADTFVFGDRAEVFRQGRGQVIPRDDLASARQALARHIAAPGVKKTDNFPLATCLWLNSKAAQQAQLNVSNLVSFINKMSERRIRVPVHPDVMLDTYCAVLGNVLMLERLDMVSRMLSIIEEVHDEFDLFQKSDERLRKAITLNRATRDRLGSIGGGLVYESTDLESSPSQVRKNMRIMAALAEYPYTDEVQRLQFEAGQDAAKRAMNLWSIYVGPETDPVTMLTEGVTAEDLVKRALGEVRP